MVKSKLFVLVERKSGRRVYSTRNSNLFIGKSPSDIIKRKGTFNRKEYALIPFSKDDTHSLTKKHLKNVNKFKKNLIKARSKSKNKGR